MTAILSSCPSLDDCLMSDNDPLLICCNLPGAACRLQGVSSAAGFDVDSLFQYPINRCVDFTYLFTYLHSVVV